MCLTCPPSSYMNADYKPKHTKLDDKESLAKEHNFERLNTWDCGKFGTRKPWKKEVC